MKVGNFVRKIEKEGGQILHYAQTDGCNTASIPGVKMASNGIGGYMPPTTLVVYKTSDGKIRKETFEGSK